ncbi:cytochrome c biogenesis protein DipZ [Spirochaeta isovalerica]|uniref:Cytochrome c biogenesis protein CcdA/thiol-disulfide isomerase/thioredoxin n=1 Tax=Spirochaeta isovalerica TaxID=150 RepID=A0A841RAZ9_9SPIO|nr:cytochrome c biogenesis protein DipZ [Spirochaeta isovalerica]MBB6480427.1 cytochrome c biogenesis protein CcdA/thiol-disulfide isomerase/thioredoxin [Spirochaeta isovalerica]
MLLLTFVAFLSGIITILSPCILPVLPIVLSGSVGGIKKPLGIISGFVVSFSFFTLFLTALVRRFGFSADTLRIAAVVLIVLFGAVLLIPRLNQLFEKTVSLLQKRTGKNKNRQGFSGGLLTGFSLGLIWTPCAGPLMASVISLSITQSVTGYSVLITLAYTIGTSLPMLAIMFGGRKLINRVPGLLKNSGKIQRFFGAVLIFTGFSIAMGWDRDFQQTVLDVFPGYGDGLTFLEQLDPVQKALDNSLNSDSGPDIDEDKAVPAPPLVTEGQWFNSEPLSMESLEGKVVIIDFWTYSCINCIRTIPYLRSWYETYRKDGLEIIGVHSPEFAFEREPENLRKAIDDLGVTWPVVQDNSFLQWRAYNNRFWPAKYIIDKNGNIRYSHFGEGGYEETEAVIRELLGETGNIPQGNADLPSPDENLSKTPETYLGYGRSTGFLAPTEDYRNMYRDFKSQKVKESGQWTLEGNWAVTENYIVNEESGTLELFYDAKDVFLVVEPVDEDVTLTVTVDGDVPADTGDLVDGKINVTDSRHYHLVGMGKGNKHLLRIEIDGKARLFAFTFG